MKNLLFAVCLLVWGLVSSITHAQVPHWKTQQTGSFAPLFYDGVNAFGNQSDFNSSTGQYVINATILNVKSGQKETIYNPSGGGETYMQVVSQGDPIVYAYDIPQKYKSFRYSTTAKTFKPVGPNVRYTDVTAASASGGLAGSAYDKGDNLYYWVEKGNVLRSVTIGGGTDASLQAMNGSWLTGNIRTRFPNDDQTFRPAYWDTNTLTLKTFAQDGFISCLNGESGLGGGGLTTYLGEPGYFPFINHAALFNLENGNVELIHAFDQYAFSFVDGFWNGYAYGSVERAWDSTPDPFLYNLKSGQIIWLNDRLGFKDPRYITVIRDISGDGYISGSLYNPFGDSFGFVASPSNVPEPSVFLFAGAFLTLTASIIRRR